MMRTWSLSRRALLCLPPLVVALAGILPVLPIESSKAGGARATPEVAASPSVGREVPSPGECTVAPRSLQEVLTAIDVAYRVDQPPGPASEDAAIASDADGLDVSVDGTAWIVDGVVVAASPALKVGGPVEIDALDEIHRTLRTTVACSNAGDLLRSLSLFSDVGLANWASLLRSYAPEYSAEETKRLVSEQEVAAPREDSWESVPSIVVARRLDPLLVGIIVERPDRTRLFYALRRIGDGWRVELFGEVSDPAGPEVLPTTTPTGDT